MLKYNIESVIKDIIEPIKVELMKRSENYSTSFPERCAYKDSFMIVGNHIDKLKKEHIEQNSIN